MYFLDIYKFFLRVMLDRHDIIIAQSASNRSDLLFSI
jgi:hypothetical protein